LDFWGGDMMWSKDFRERHFNQKSMKDYTLTLKREEINYTCN